MTDAQIERVAHAILSRPEFRYHGKSLFQRILDRIGSWITSVFNGLFSAAGHGGISLALSAIVVTVVVAVVVLLVVHTVRHRGHASPRAGRPAPVPRLTAADWIARASDAEKSGDFAEALRCRYRASVALLASRALVEEIPGGTAGEYRAQVVRTAPGVYLDFAELTGSFEAAWYAGAAAGPAEADRSRLQCEAVAAFLGRDSVGSR